jgi:hypothetical protein
VLAIRSRRKIKIPKHTYNMSKKISRVTAGSKQFCNRIVLLPGNPRTHENINWELPTKNVQQWLRVEEMAIDASIIEVGGDMVLCHGISFLVK